MPVEKLDSNEVVKYEEKEKKEDQTLGEKGLIYTCSAQEISRPTYAMSHLYEEKQVKASHDHKPTFKRSFLFVNVITKKNIPLRAWGRWNEVEVKTQAT